MDAARASRDTTLALIEDLAIRLPRKLDGELAPDDPMHSDLEDIRNIKMDSFDSIQDRGQRVLSVWTKVNARNAATVPVLPAVTAGGQAVAILSAALTALPVKEHAVEDARAVLNDRRSAVRTLAGKVDRNNKRWYAAWQGEFVPGTPAGDALSQIDTGAPGGGGSGGGNPPPAAPLNATFTQANPGDAVEANADAAAGVTLVRVYQRAVGDTNPPVLIASAATLPTSFTIGPGDYEFTMTYGNANGESAPSAPVTLTVG